jgi:anti-sigma B factor antagonist
MFDIRLGEQGEVVCEGRLDASQAVRAQAFLDALPAPDVIDLSRLEYISSAGLGVLLRTQKRVLQTGGGLRLVKVSRHIRDIFRYSGFDRIFEIESGG